MLSSEVTEDELDAALLRVPPVEFSRAEPTLLSSSSLMSWRGGQSVSGQAEPWRAKRGREAAGRRRRDIPGLSPAAATARSSSHPSGRARQEQGIQSALGEVREVGVALKTAGDVGGEVGYYM